MDMEKTGGPAYPLKEPMNVDWTGMTLRDYFAGQSLPVILCETGNIGPVTAARYCYQCADAMIAERDK